MELGIIVLKIYIREGGAMRADVLSEIDNYFGFESDGDFVNWPVSTSFSNMNDVEDLIDNFTEYFVESVGGRGDYVNVGYGRDIRTQTTFNVLPKGTPDGDEDVFRKAIVVNETTKIGDIFKQLGYQSLKNKH